MDWFLKAWTAYSFASTAVGASGIALMVVGAWLAPGRLKVWLVALGMLILSAAALYQQGRSAGVSETVDLANHQASEAEKIRAQLAAEDAAEDAKKLEAELAQARADNAELKRINDALATDPERDRRCLTVDDARRLRELRSGDR
ncbi:hypothetical protein [Methylobacterium sp. AMS5]|uniref:hypothetical protein n=1 Tax=Methylobacterium sp. AMS5 TaxID=925818 RepID=UPI00074F9967|nr:hypothetical protein [Methylobacterium sp. AMS5]AMB48249.1 hypothetical protein Y590_25105 [Methylobacterium sp. AMS5]